MKTTQEPKSVRTVKGLGAETAWARASRTTLLGAALLAGLGGCSLPEGRPDLTRYYVITPVAAKADAPATERPSVLVRPVVVPEFLRGRIMQLRVAENELRFVDEARWAEPLEAGLLRVVRENLERLATVRLVERGGEAHDYEVAVRLRRYDGVLPGGMARIGARIEVYSTELEPKLVAQDEFVREIPGWDGVNHADLARKLSEAAAALSERIGALVPSRK